MTRRSGRFSGKYDTSRIADRIREKFFTEVVTSDDRAFIERADRIPP